MIVRSMTLKLENVSESSYKKLIPLKVTIDDFFSPLDSGLIRS